MQFFSGLAGTLQALQAQWQELINQLVSIQKQNQILLEKLINIPTKTTWEIWIPPILQFGTIVVAIFVLYRTTVQNRRNEFLPYLKQLHEELDDCILTIYDLLHNPKWEAWDKETKERVAENYTRLHDNFKDGKKYFVISAIPYEHGAIEKLIKNAGRRKMYFNEVRKRYITMYEALIKASNSYGSTQPLYEYFRLTEYEGLYEAFKKMPNINY